MPTTIRPNGYRTHEAQRWVSILSRVAWQTVLCAALPLGLVNASFGQGGEPAAIFQDCTQRKQLELENSSVCWVDLNNDGWVDLCAGSVWLNQGGKTFARWQEGVGCVVAADYDNDGYADLFSWSSQTLFRNEQGQKLVPVSLPARPNTVSRGACWGDFDRDGFVDLYIGGYEDWDAGVTYPDMILRNDGGQTFQLMWSEVRYRARGVTACDFDEDGDLDVYVSNYRLQPNVLWRNDGAAHFQDAAESLNAVATSDGFAGGHSIGAAWGDFDNDGRFDLFAGNFAHVDDRGDQPKSRFLHNLGAAQGFRFDDLGPCGVFYQESYATPAAGDSDNDGDLDLYFTTVYAVASFHRTNHAVLYRNDGNFSFSDFTANSGLAEQPPTSQAAWADFDRDGDLDLATAGRLFENQTQGQHWLEVRLRGDGKRTNRAAIGAQVRLLQAGPVQTRQVEAGTGEGNQNDLLLHFGLAKHSEPVALEIFWPDGRRQQVANVAVDQLIEFAAVGEPRP